MKTTGIKIGKGVRIIIGVIFILAGTIILTFGQTSNCAINNEFYKILNNELLKSDILPNMIAFNTRTTGIIAENLAEANEEEVKIEDWMLDEAHFSFTKENAEIKPSLEPWMLNFDITKTGREINDFEIETEEKLEIEDWMLDEKHFMIDYENEEPVQLEEWMTNSDSWK